MMALNVRGVHGGSFEISDPDSLWAGHNLHDLYQQPHIPGSGTARSWSSPVSWA